MQKQLSIIKTEKAEVYRGSYYKMREHVALPLKIKMFYGMLQNCLDKKNHKQSQPIIVSKDFEKKYKILLTAFKHQTEEQKVRLLYNTIKILKNNFLTSSKDSEKDSDCFSSESDGLKQIKEIQTTCKVKETLLGVTKWNKKGFRFNRRHMRVKVIGLESKKQLSFNLKLYFVRKSRKHSKTLILERISQQIQNNFNEIYVYFENTILFEEIYENLYTCVIQHIAKELLAMANEKDNDVEETTTSNDMNKASIILTSKVLNDYFKEKDKILRKLHNCSYNFQSVETNLKDITIGISKHNSKTRIKIDKIFKCSSTQVQSKLSLISRKTNKSLVEFEVLQKFSTNIFATYFKYIFNGQIYEFLNIMEEHRKDYLYTVIFRGINNFINKQFIDFISLSVKEQNPSTTVLQLVGIIKSEIKKKNMIIDFLLSLIQPITNENQSPPSPSTHRYSIPMQQGEAEEESKEGEQCFETVRGMEFVQMEEMEQKSFPYIEIEKPYEKVPEKILEIQNKILSPFLARNFRYALEPEQKKQGSFIPEYYLKKQWKLSKNSGFVCINEEQINEHKKVFKCVLSQMKNNVLKGKSILNVSFPVTIFRDQSQLKSVARNYSYAPIFLENLTSKSPIEKIKQVILFHISSTNLTISMNKPFNPILGETYQGFIDGCPIFLEQISHHPPISSFLFHGRGYKMHGIIEPKVVFGLNCVKGWSQQPTYIEFDDGQVLEFTISKMLISGMLFGERTFAFDGSNYILDRKNQIAAQIVYKANNSSSFFKKTQCKNDTVSAQIFNVKINGNQPWDKIKKENKECLGKVEGIWHSQIYTNSSLSVDFQKLLPHTIEDHEFPIPSDSSFRSDVKSLRDGNLSNAQINKDYLEDIQRADKKLRERYQLEMRRTLYQQK